MLRSEEEKNNTTEQTSQQFFFNNNYSDVILPWSLMCATRVVLCCCKGRHDNRLLKELIRLVRPFLVFVTIIMMCWKESIWISLQYYIVLITVQFTRSELRSRKLRTSMKREHILDRHPQLQWRSSSMEASPAYELRIHFYYY